jgi:tetratricopeptide (TPR) repeat protein
LTAPDRSKVTSLPELRRLLDASDGPDGLRGQSLHLRQDSPEMDYFMARRGLDEPDHLAHGLSHLASLLAHDPVHAEWTALLDQYQRAHGGDLEELLPKSEQRYFAYEALRAWCRAKRGELDAAIRLLSDVVRAKPSCRYLETWGVAWLEPAGAVEQLTLETLARFLMTSLSQFPEASELPLGRLERVQRIARVSARAAPSFSRRADLVMTVAGLHRKAGMFDEALRFARAEQRPSWHSRVAEGLVLRQAGQPSEAEVAFRAAARLDPTDISAFLELGDTWFLLEEWGKAARAYEDALERDANDAWATASLVWCRWRSHATTPPSWQTLPDALKTMAREGNSRARELCSELSWYFGVLPPPPEATANMIRQAQAKGTRVTSVALTDVESPSNLVAFALIGNDDVELAYSHVATPDPREPVQPVAFTLWRRDGDVLVPALPPPPADVRDRIAELASGPYQPTKQWARASRLARQLGPGAVEALLACIGHPPPLPRGGDVLEWLPRVQHAVASTLAHLDDGWDDSVRRRALLSLLLGPRDWSTEAAIVALARLASDLEWIGLDVHSAFLALDRARPDSGGCCYEYALLRFWSGLPGLFPDERKALRERLDALDES